MWHCDKVIVMLLFFVRCEIIDNVCLRLHVRLGEKTFIVNSIHLNLIYDKFSGALTAWNSKNCHLPIHMQDKENDNPFPQAASSLELSPGKKSLVL